MEIADELKALREEVSELRKELKTLREAVFPLERTQHPWGAFPVQPLPMPQYPFQPYYQPPLYDPNRAPASQPFPPGIPVVWGIGVGNTCSGELPG